MELTHIKKKKLFKELLDVIYTDTINYDAGVGSRSNWWHTMHVGPIIAKKYNVHLVAYDGYGNKNMVNKKTHIFTKSCNEPEIIYELKSY